MNRQVLEKPEKEATIAGALAPDLIDKPLAWILRVTQSSHTIGHTPLAAVVLSTFVSALFGRSKGRSFASAYVVHLMGDEIHHGRVPWFLPLSNWKRRPKGPRRKGLHFSFETLFFLALEVPSLALLIHFYGIDKREELPTGTAVPAGASPERGEFAPNHL